MVAPLVLAGIGQALTGEIVQEVNKMNQPQGKASGESVGGRQFGLSSEEENYGVVERGMAIGMSAGKGIGGGGGIGSGSGGWTGGGGSNMEGIISQIAQKGLPQKGIMNQNTRAIGSYV